MKKPLILGTAMSLALVTSNALPAIAEDMTAPSISPASEQGVTPSASPTASPSSSAPSIAHVDYSGFKESEDNKDILTSAQTYVQVSKQAEEAERNSTNLKDQSIEDKVRAFKKKLKWESTSVDSNIIRSTFKDKPDTGNEWEKQITDYKKSLHLSEGEFNQGARTIVSEASQDKAEAAKDVPSSETEAQKAKKKTAALKKQLTQAQEDFQKASAQRNEKTLEDNIRTTSVPQQALNKAMVDQWNIYIDKLNSNYITLHSAKEMADKDFYRKNPNLVAYTDNSGKTVSGVAALKSDTDVYVLPKEAMERVAAQYKELDKQYNPNGNGKNNAWSCAALVGTSYPKQAQSSISQMWNSAGQVSAVSKLPGDTVFYGGKTSGLTNVGTYLGNGMMLSASAVDKQVAVGADSGAYGYKRLEQPVVKGQAQAPQTAKKAWKQACGATLQKGKEAAGWREWSSPIADGKYSLGDKYESSDEKWGEEGSPGLEFISKEKKGSEFGDGELVRAVADGVVTEVKHDAKQGNVVTIAHKNKGESSYAFLKKALVPVGAKVYQKDVIGTTGATGKQAQKGEKSVLLTMKSSGESMDPERLIFPEHFAQDTAPSVPSDTTIPSPESTSTDAPDAKVYDGYTNGQLPDSALCALPQEGHRLRCDAVPSFLAMNAAYKAHFGHDMCITDSYRSYAEQVDVKARKPGLAATPGTSNHGWGLAIDFCDDIEDFGSAQHQWMQDNSKKFSWWHPDWAEQDGSKPEAWHWESFLSKRIKKN